MTSSTAYAPPEPPITPHGVEAVERMHDASSSDRTEPDNASVAPISITLDEFHQFIVQDVLGAAYGVGATPEEAVADYWDVLSEHLAFLREHADELDDSLLRQRAQLEKLFPGR